MKGKHIVASALAVTICLMGCSNNKQADIDAEVTKLEEEAKKTLQDVQEYSKEDIEKATTYIHIKEQSLIQKQPSKSEGCFCIYARKA